MLIRRMLKQIQSEFNHPAKILSVPLDSCKCVLEIFGTGAYFSFDSFFGIA